MSVLKSIYLFKIGVKYVMEEPSDSIGDEAIRELSCNDQKTGTMMMVGARYKCFLEGIDIDKNKYSFETYHRQIFNFIQYQYQYQ